MDASEVLKVVAGEVAVCKNCALQFSRKLSVPGEGPTNAEILFIGEGPGFYENEAGRPFVGNAGKFLDELLGQAGVNRAQVFITNVVKCRPPGNRDPLPEELQACSNYLDRQIAALNPKMIVTLGRFSMAKFLPNAKISGVHGQSFWINHRLVVPMYHPAAALHQPSLKADIVKDFSKLPGYLKMMVEGQGGGEARQGAEGHSVHEKTPQLEKPAPVSTAAPLRSPPIPAQVQQISLPLADLPPKPPEPVKPEDDKKDQDKDKPVQLSLF